MERTGKVLMLRSSLTCNVLSILWDLGSDKDYSYEKLVDMLRTRYGSKSQTETYRLQLRTRRQSRGESLSNLMQDIRKLMALAYPGKTSELIEEIARDVFIEALYNRNLALQVLTKEPRSLNEAFQIATKLHSYGELVFQADRSDNARNSINSKYREERKSQNIYDGTKESSEQSINSHEFQRVQEMITELSKKMEEMKFKMERRDSSDRTRERTQETAIPKKIICYECGIEGRRRFECPNKASDFTRYANNETSTKKVRFRRSDNNEPMRETDSRRSQHFSEPETEPKHVSSTGDGSLYVNLRLNGSMRKCFIGLRQ